jgi:hypothetical protein
MDWTATATFAVAGVTVALAGATVWLGFQARGSTEATKQTIAEIQRDRDLEFRPYVSWPPPNITGVLDNPNAFAATAQIDNLGRGPLFDGLCCLTWRPGGPTTLPQYLATTNLFDLPPQHRPSNPSLQIRGGDMPNDDIAGNPVTEEPVRFAFCRDQLGHNFRFVPHKKPDDWQEGQSERPPWVDFYLSHSQALYKM